MSGGAHLSLFGKFQLFLASSVAWTAIFLVVNSSISAKNLKKRDLDDIKNRVISILHGLFSLISTALHIYYDDPQYGTINTAHQEILIIISCGYFFYDMIACAYYKLTDAALIIHHSMTIMGYVSCFVYGYGATEAIMGLYLAEVSNCPMHLRMIFKNLNLRYTLAYEVLEYFYMATYMVSRGIFVPRMVWDTVPNPMTPLPEKFPMCGLAIQSVYYIFEMVKILRRRVVQHKERISKGVQLAWFKEVPELSKLSYYQKETNSKIF